MKKYIALLLSFVLVLTVFAGCQSQSSGTATTAAASSGSTAAASTDAPSGGFKLSGDVEFVCPYSAGGGSDLYARTAGNIMGEKGLLGGRTITVNNKTGGSGAVGDAYTATKAGDGTVITTYVSAQITGPMINGTEITYKDLTPICNLAMDEYTIGVLSTAEYKTLDEFIAYAKANPGKITVGGSGSGTEDNLVTGLMQMYCGIEVEYIPYNSSAEVMTAMLGGHINAGIYNPNEAISQYEAGDVLLLAAFGPERISVLPDVPTFTELGYDQVVFQQFRGIFGPGNMSQEAVDFWVSVFQEVIQDSTWTDGYLAKNGLTSKFLSGAEFDTFLDEEAAKYEAVLSSLGLMHS